MNSVAKEDESLKQANKISFNDLKIEAFSQFNKRSHAYNHVHFPYDMKSKSLVISHKSDISLSPIVESNQINQKYHDTLEVFDSSLERDNV